MKSTEALSFVQKVRRNRGKAFHRLRKELRGTAVSLFRPELGKDRPGNAVMFHVGRSGSTVLGDMLDQHPRVYWDSEVYHPLLEDRNRAGYDPMEILARRMTRAGKKYYGFEIKPVHFTNLELEPDRFIQDLLRMRFSHFIVLERKNYLRKITSSVIAHQFGVFHRSPNEALTPRRGLVDPNSVAIDNDARPLLQWLREYDRFFAGLRDLLREMESLWLTYEDDIFASPDVAFKKVCEYLSLESKVEPQIRYEMTNPFEMKDLILNFDAVERELRGTEFEWMLYD